MAVSNPRRKKGQQAMAYSGLVAARAAGWPLWKLTVILAGVLLVALPIAMTEAAVPGLEQNFGRSRVLLLFAPRPEDPALLRQRNILADASAAAGERNLVPVEVTGAGPNEAELRCRFGAADIDHFRAVLVGKDGRAKLSSAEPIPADRLLQVIDAMPMRRGESASRKPDGR